MTNEPRAVDFLEQLRGDFDRSFAQPSKTEATELVEFLAFRVGGTCYAVRLQHVGAVHELRAMTRVPCHSPGFDGLTAVQGQLVAVYDLAAWVTTTGKASSRRWLLVCHEDRQVGFTVDTVDGYLRIPPSRVVATEDSQQRSTSVSHAFDDDSGPRLVVDFSLLLDSLRHVVEREGVNTR
jgi:purine-binding chemotaxis protein CheW